MSEYRLKKFIVGDIDELLQQDGRARVCASPVLGPKRETSFSVAMVKHIIQQFLSSGSSNHSGSGSCLPFIIDYCEQHRIPYTLRAHFTKAGQRCGYYIQREAYLDDAPPFTRPSSFVDEVEEPNPAKA